MNKAGGAVHSFVFVLLTIVVEASFAQGGNPSESETREPSWTAPDLNGLVCGTCRCPVGFISPSDKEIERAFTNEAAGDLTGLPLEVVNKLKIIFNGRCVNGCEGSCTCIPNEDWANLKNHYRTNPLEPLLTNLKLLWHQLTREPIRIQRIELGHHYLDSLKSVSCRLGNGNCVSDNDCSFPCAAGEVAGCEKGPGAQINTFGSCKCVQRGTPSADGSASINSF